MASVRELLVKITGDGADLEKELNRAAKKVDAVGRRLENVGRDLSLKFTAPMLAAGAVATKLGTDFDVEMTKIITLVGVAEEQVAAWREELLQIGPEVGRGPRELARALQAVTSAGETGAEALEIVNLSARASAVGLGETQTIARLVTAALQTYGAEGLTAAEATDILVQTVREGAAEAEDLAGVLGQVLGVAAQVGVSFAEVGAFVGVFTRLGISAEEAVTALRGTLTTFLNPADQARKALDGMGLSVDTLRRKVAEEGLAPALIELVQRAEETGTEIATIVPNVRALAGVLGTAGVQGDAFREVAESIRDSVGALDDAFSRIEVTPAHTFAQLRATLETLAVTLGDVLTPSLQEVVKATIPYLRAVRELDADTVKLIAKLVAMTAAIGPLLLGLGSVTRTAATLAQTLILVRAGGIALGSMLLPGGAILVGLALLAKHFIDARIEAARTAIATGALRAEIAALGSQARTERGIAVALGIIDLEDKLKAARERLEELQSQARTEILPIGAPLTIEARGTQEAREEVAALEQQLEGLRTELRIINETEAEAAERTRELDDVFEQLRGSAGGVASTTRGVADVMEDLEQALSAAEQLGQLSDEFDENALAIAALQSALRELVHLEGDHEEQILAVAAALNERRAIVAREQEERQKALEAEQAAQRAVNEDLALFQSLLAQSRTPAEIFAETLAALNRLLEAGKISAEDYARAIEQAREVLEEETDEMGDSLENLSEVGRDVANDLLGFFVDFALGAERSFGDFVRSAIRDLSRLLLRLLLLRALTAAFPGLQLFGGRAGGGPVSAGKAYTVGEHGREVFVPSTSGTIVPMRSAGGSSSGADPALIVAEVFARVPAPPAFASPEVLAQHRYWRAFGAELARVLEHDGVRFPT